MTTYTTGTNKKVVLLHIKEVAVCTLGIAYESMLLFDLVTWLCRFIHIRSSTFILGTLH